MHQPSATNLHINELQTLDLTATLTHAIEDRLTILIQEHGLLSKVGHLLHGCAAGSAGNIAAGGATGVDGNVLHLHLHGTQHLHRAAVLLLLIVSVLLLLLLLTRVRIRLLLLLRVQRSGHVRGGAVGSVLLLLLQRHLTRSRSTATNAQIQVLGLLILNRSRSLASNS